MASTGIIFPSRAHNRILKVARPLADLARSKKIRSCDIREFVESSSAIMPR